MRTPISRFERATGIFLFAVAILLVLAVLGSGRWMALLEMLRSDFTVVAVSDGAHGAVVGSPVKVRDVEVGSVKSIALVEDPAHKDKPVRITMRVQRKAARFLREKTIAIVVEPPLGSGMPPFGTSSIELESAGDVELADGAVIEAEGRESMVTSMARMSRDVSAMRDEMTRSIEEMGTSFANLRKLTDELVSGRGVAGRMLRDDRMADQLDAAMRDARNAANDARKLMAEATKVTQQAPGVIDDVRALSKEGKQLLGKLDAAADSLPALIAATERTLALAEELTKNLRAATGSAPELARKVDSSLEETNRLVEAAQQNFLLRSTLPDRKALRTEAAVRPPVVLPAAGTP